MWIPVSAVFVLFASAGYWYVHLFAFAMVYVSVCRIIIAYCRIHKFVNKTDMQ